MLRRGWQTLLAAAATLALAVAVTLGTAGPAAALTYQVTNGSRYDFRGWVNAPTTYFFGCSPGLVHVADLQLRGASFPMHVYYTYDLEYLSTSGQWVPYRVPGHNGDTAYPGGRDLAAYHDWTPLFPHFTLQTFAAYWRISVSLDFHAIRAGQVAESLGGVRIASTQTSDWFGSYSYQGNGYAYCYHY